MLHSSHRKAVIPCKAKRTYKVNLVAISADKNFSDSGMSNTLLITPGGAGVVRFVDGPQEEEREHDDSDLVVKVMSFFLLVFFSTKIILVPKCGWQRVILIQQ